MPLLIVIPLFIGIDGVMYSGPIADFFAGVICAIMVVKEFRKDIYLESKAWINFHALSIKENLLKPRHFR